MPSIVVDAGSAIVGSLGHQLYGNTGTYYGYINKASKGSNFSVNVKKARAVICMKRNAGSAGSAPYLTYPCLIGCCTIASGSPAGGVVATDFTGGTMYQLRIDNSGPSFVVTKGALNAAGTTLVSGPITSAAITGGAMSGAYRVALEVSESGATTVISVYSAANTTANLKTLEGFTLEGQVVDASPLSAGGWGYGAKSNGITLGGVFDNFECITL